ncbi:MAG: alcohol dehydrogenase catalytic domain-containing protein [Deltaproteobacteria bacterium]|nr:alcohol dehydrogenase catalytic domain-containing protein [Deltaproteobacteria bacterium]
MKAVVFRKGRGLVVEELPVPDPGPDAVLVQVSNTGFCGSDHSLIESGLLADGTILGHEVSGTVAAVGRAVTGVRAGSRVMIRPTFCGKCRDCLMGKPHLCGGERRSIGIGDLPGGFAEYVKVYPQMLIPIPAGVDSRNAALAETFAAALHGIRSAGSESGSVLVMGGGPIGLAAVRCLHLLGFSPIALSEPQAEKRAVGGRFGADRLIDPLKEDLRQMAREWTGGVGFETILECSGAAGNIPLAFELAAKSCTVCLISILFRGITLEWPMLVNFKELRLSGAYSNTHAENVRCVEWMARGEIDARPLISDLIPLEELPRTYGGRIHTGKAVKVMLQIGPEF